MTKYSYYINIAIICVTVLILIALIVKLLNILANNYIKKHNESLYSLTTTIAQNCEQKGQKLISDESLYDYHINKLGLNDTFDCSSSILSNAQNNNIKYLIKYSNIDYNFDCLEEICFCSDYSKTFEDFHIITSELTQEIKNNLPFFVSLFSSDEKIPFFICDIDKQLNKLTTPIFRFSYVSPAGKSTRICDIEITHDILEKVKYEINAKLQKKGNSKKQRSAMTNDLREAIKARDNYTCCICGNSVYKEPNLLLEVDHIIPISKGGKTEASNLQTLCWRCNRKKGNKAINLDEHD